MRRPSAHPGGHAISADLIITNALVVTCDAAGTVVRDGAAAVKAGRIDAVGPAEQVGRDAAEVIDAQGRLLMPGLVNTQIGRAHV